MSSQIFADCSCAVHVNIATQAIVRNWYMPFDKFPSGLTAGTPVYPFPAYKKFERTSADYPSDPFLNGYGRLDGISGTIESTSSGFEEAAYANVFPGTVTLETDTSRAQLRGSDVWTETLTELVESSDQLAEFAAAVPWEDPLIFDLAHNLIAAFTVDELGDLETAGAVPFAACNQWIYVGNRHDNQELQTMAAMRINRTVNVYHFARTTAFTEIAGCRDFSSYTPFAGPISVASGDIILPPDVHAIMAAGGTSGYAAVNLAGMC